jgi:tetratricopeptide (TPR) repeat protein
MTGKGQNVASAWYALLDQKIIRIEAEELAALERDAAKPTSNNEERTMFAFALGKAYEDSGDYTKALDALTRANALARADRPWDAVSFSARVNAVQNNFRALKTKSSIQQGAEVLFVAGLPRSGTTLIE